MLKDIPNRPAKSDQPNKLVLNWLVKVVLSLDMNWIWLHVY